MRGTSTFRASPSWSSPTCPSRGRVTSSTTCATTHGRRCGVQTSSSSGPWPTGSPCPGRAASRACLGCLVHSPVRAAPPARRVRAGSRRRRRRARLRAPVKPARRGGGHLGLPPVRCGRPSGTAFARSCRSGRSSRSARRRSQRAISTRISGRPPSDSGRSASFTEPALEWSRGGSNPWPSRCQRDALPAELRPRWSMLMLAGRTSSRPPS